ncbi:MAG: peptidoglycan DD-metalloendopeptidase family protein [Pseudomonadales bacterium]|nr:peptidoglycan DD-metalloendopeptidase family protein [Pseudomonadales bacterium]
MELPHPRKITPQLILVVTLIFLPLNVQSNASTERELSTKQTKLENIKEGIFSLLNKIKSDKNSYIELQKTLRKNEKEISSVSKRVIQNDKKIINREQNINKLEIQIAEKTNTLDSSKQRMANDLRILQRQGSNSPTKLFLSMEDPSSLSRSVYYQKRIQYARERKLKEIVFIREALKAQQEQLTSEKQQLAALQEALSFERKSLDKNQKQRRHTLSQLKKGLKNERTQLARKRKDVAQLQALIAKLTQKLQAIDKDGKNFLGRKGTLTWPTTGKLVHRFNQKRTENGQLRWQGVVIRGAQGQNVNAVFSGQVVFSDWMTGFGNLLIIDHGGGYLSLYGHNQTLLKNPGEHVIKGEQIATLGNSGGELENALYFEIRHKNKALNPSRWCRR